MKQYFQGFCDIMPCDDKRTAWDEPVGKCKSYQEKHKQVIDNTGTLPYCIKVCGNCEHFTVGKVVEASTYETVSTK